MSVENGATASCRPCAPACVDAVAAASSAMDARDIPIFNMTLVPHDTALTDIVIEAAVGSL